MTIKEMIAKLEEMAQEVGEDAKVCTYDEYTANEGWDYTEDDLRVEVDTLSLYTREEDDKVVIVIY